MYAREVADRTLTFVVSGLLWEGSLVMADLETESLWNHLLGKSMKGPLVGEELLLPSVMTDWKTWCNRYPDTTVAAFSRAGYIYRNRLHRFESTTLGDLLVIGLARGETSKDWSFDRLRKQPIVNSHFDNQPVLVSFIPPAEQL